MQESVQKVIIGFDWFAPAMWSRFVYKRKFYPNIMELSRTERIEAFNLLNELKGNGLSIGEIIRQVHCKFPIPKGTLYCWFEGKQSPFGSIGKLKFNKELFYVLGALLGDGCIYHWRAEHQLWLIGDEKFTKKFASRLSVVIGRNVKNYRKRKRNYWFVKISNIQLYNLFKGIRSDLNKLEIMAKEGDFINNCLQLIEGFFDAEGCVKIIKEEVRKTPKICLDITNTNYALLEIINKFLKNALAITAKYSIQKYYVGKDGCNRKEAYHLRIYKKSSVKHFLGNVNTTKLNSEKEVFVKAWLNNGK